jgi:hypothetical protein
MVGGVVVVVIKKTGICATLSSPKLETEMCAFTTATSRQRMNPRACCLIDLGYVNPSLGEALSGDVHIGTRRIFNPKTTRWFMQKSNSCGRGDWR